MIPISKAKTMIPTLFAVFLLATTTITAAEAPTITLRQALDAATENNIDLSIAQIQLQQSLRTQNSATAFLPSISLSGGVSTGGSLIGGTFSGVSANISTGISMNFSGSMLTDSTTRSLAKENANLTYQKTYSSLEASVVSYYWNLAANINAVETSRLSLEQAKQQLETAKQQYDNGVASQLTVAQAQLAVSEAELQVRQMEDSKNLAITSLKAVTGITETDFSLEPLPETIELALPDAQRLYAEYASNSTTIKSLQNAVDQAVNDSKTQKLSSRVPTVGVSASWNLSGNLVDGNVSNNSTAKALSDNASVSVSVSVPLSSYIPGTTQNLAIKDTEDAVTIAQLKLQAGQDSMLQSIENSIATITQQQESLRLKEQNLETAQYTYDLSVEAFEAGLLSNQDLEASRTSLLNAEIEVLSGRLSHLLNCYDLASLLETDLDTLQTRYATSR